MQRWPASNMSMSFLTVSTPNISRRRTSRQPRSAVFWGRLDFGPNLQAIDWFCHRIWPEFGTVPSALLTIMGFNAEPERARADARNSARLRRARHSLRRGRESDRPAADDFRRRHQEQAAGGGGDGKSHRLHLDGLQVVFAAPRPP